MLTDHQITLEKALHQKRRGAVLIDVRSPDEFAEANIPGAVNVPLFSNDERAQVGTVFRRQGKKAARRLGVELVAPRIPELIREVEAVRKENSGPVIVYCWRGGMRSLALTSFLNLAGIPAQQLIGGHKAFRKMIVDYFESEQWPPIFVLRGLTGVGKTRVLHALHRDEYPVVDLEGLANHRGSAFGALGLEPQPSQKMFEAMLWDCLVQLENSSYLLTEGESLHIGRVLVPKRFHQAMQSEKSLWLTASLATRAQLIVEEYPALDRLRDQFVRPLSALKERLGKAVLAELMELLETGQWTLLARELMVRYYDPLYLHTLPEQRVEICVDDFKRGIADIKLTLKQLSSDG